MKAGDGIFTLDNIQFDPNPLCQVVGLLNQPNGAMAGLFEYNIGVVAIKTASGEVDMSLSSGYYTSFRVVEAQMYRALDAVTAVDASTQQSAWLVNVRDDNLQIERAMNNLGPAVSSVPAVFPNLSRALTDGYDFRTFISTTTTACDAGRTQGQHFVVQSSVPETASAR